MPMEFRDQRTYGGCEFPPETLGSVVKFPLAVEGPWHCSCDDGGAEARAIRLPDHWATALVPRHVKLLDRREPAIDCPADLDFPGWHRERAIFRRIGGKLVQGKPQVLSGRGF